MKNYILTGAVLLLSVCAIPAASAQDNPATTTASTTPKTTLNESQKIERLINCLRTLEGASFIRNGSEHSSKEAAEHLAAKWKKHGSKIKTAEDFIDHLATKSSSSGEIYKIKFADGKTVPTSEMLYKELRQLTAESEEKYKK